MVADSYKLFFRVVETYKVNGHLVLVSDRVDSGLARTSETIQVRMSGKEPQLYQAGCVSFWRQDNSSDIPFCMSIKGVKPEDIPVGSQVWIEERALVQGNINKLGRYRKSAVPQIVAKAPSVQSPCPAPMPSQIWEGGQQLKKGSEIEH